MMAPHAFYKLSPSLLQVWATLLDVTLAGGGGGAKVGHGKAGGAGVQLNVFRKQHYRVAVSNLVAFIRRVRQRDRGGGGGHAPGGGGVC